MSAKPFAMLIITVLVLGAAIGGAFVGGVTVGKDQVEDAPITGLPEATSDPSSQGFDQASLDDLRQRLRTGELDPAALESLRQQFQGQRVPGAGGRGSPGGLTGTIEEIVGNTVTVNTDLGPLLATITSDTTIQMFTVGTADDLEMNMRVTVIGQPGEDGTVEAVSIVLVPEGGAGFPGGRFPAGGFQGSD